MLDKDITAEGIGEFVAGEQLPLVVEFNDEVCLLQYVIVLYMQQ